MGINVLNTANVTYVQYIVPKQVAQEGDVDINILF